MTWLVGTEVLVATLAIYAITRELKARYPSGGVRPVSFLLCSSLCLYGYLALFTFDPNFRWVHSATEWPVGLSIEVVRDEAGNQVVPLAAAERIQIYNPANQFVRGFYVDTGGGPFAVGVTKDHEIQVVAVRRDRRLFYSFEGNLLREGGANQVTSQGSAGRGNFPYPWILIPFASPAFAWLLAAAGAFGVWWVWTHEAPRDSNGAVILHPADARR